MENYLLGLFKMCSICDCRHQQMEERSWEALHIYTDFYHNIIIRAHVRWQLTHSGLLLLLNQKVNPSEFWREIDGHQT